MLTPDADHDLEVTVADVDDGLAAGVLDDDLDGVQLADIRRLLDPAEGDAVRPEVLQDMRLRVTGDEHRGDGCDGHGDAYTPNPREMRASA